MAARKLTPSTPDVGRRIVEARKRLDISREDLAARVRAHVDTDTTTKTLGTWENDGRLSVGELRVVSEILDVSVAWLLTGQEQPYDDATVINLWTVMNTAAASIQARAEKLPRRVTQEWYDAFVSDQEAVDAVRGMLGIGDDPRTDEARRYIDEVLRFARERALEAKRRLD